MVSTRNKRLLSQLGEFHTYFIVGQYTHETQTENGSNTMEENIISSNANNPTQVISCRVDVHTLEQSIDSKVRSEVDDMMTTVEIRVQNVILTSMECLVIPRVELAMISVNVSSGRDIDGVVPDAGQRFFKKYRRPSDDRLK